MPVILGINSSSSSICSNFCRYSPWRILEDAGGAFAMGAIGGSLWHSIKGFKNSPKVSIPPEEFSS